jgi:hypothetical protein
VDKAWREKRPSLKKRKQSKRRRPKHACMDLEIKSIDIGTERLVRAERQESNVSTIEITVTKAGSK